MPSPTVGLDIAQASEGIGMHGMALRPINVLSLCSGIGGLDLGVERGSGGRARAVCHVEGEAFAAAVLAARMQDGDLADAPIWADVKTFDPGPWRGVVDCITAGYPCQPFSSAGKRRGEQDPRHLWPFITDIIRAIEPAMVFCENVPGHLTLGFEQVCHDLQGMGYAVEAGIFSAAEVGAPHIRKRLFFFAHAYSADLRNAEGIDGASGLSAEFKHYGVQRNVADARRAGQQGRRKPIQHGPQPASFAGSGADVADPHGIHGWAIKRPDVSVGRQSPDNKPANCSQDVADASGARHTQRGCSTGAAGFVQGRLPKPNGPCADVADTNSPRQSQSQRLQPDITRRLTDSSPSSLGPDMADPHGIRRQVRPGADVHPGQPRPDSSRDSDGAGPAITGLGGTPAGPAPGLDAAHAPWGPGWEDGCPRTTSDKLHRIDRLRALGNAVVPATAELAWRTLTAQAGLHF